VANNKTHKMNNRLLFLVFHDIDEGNGVSNKIKSQINAFKHNGFDVDFSYLIKEDGFLKKRQYNNSVIDKANTSYYSQKYGYKYRYSELLEKIIQREIQVVYIRYTHFANPFFTRFLSKLKKHNIKILLEIPTYPYDSEFTNVKFKQKLFLQIEHLSRQRFKKYCDKIITVSDDKEIFGTETIRISNGIEIDSITPRNVLKKEHSDNYRLVGVANVRFWHGYDRLIKGLKDYYLDQKPKAKVYFDMIGDSNNQESNEYRDMVKQYGLEDYVIFHGVLKADELNEYFDKADMAVGSLGIHRIGLKEAKPIKNREYCARGIPFIYSMIDKDFDETDFILKAADNDSNINIEAVVQFLENYNISVESERRYAEEHLTWNTIVNKIINEM
jgi:glycosyltransferase involved in cell wall biosynthesis